MSDSNQTPDLELEFTFLASAIPDEITNAIPKRLIDIYIPDTDSVHPRLRLRQKGESFELTKKVPVAEGDASTQYETTIKLDNDEFDALRAVSKKSVVKDRYEVVINGYPAEVDVFLEDLKGLILIDFEFSNEDERSKFTAPAICLADVTQEDFIAGGQLAGKSYADIEHFLKEFNYRPL